MTANGAWNNPHTSSRVVPATISVINEAETWGLRLVDTLANVWSNGSSLVPVVCPFETTRNRGTKCREKPTRPFLRLIPTKTEKKTENSGMFLMPRRETAYLKTHREISLEVQNKYYLGGCSLSEEAELNLEEKCSN